AHIQCAQLAHDLQPTAPSPDHDLFDQLSSQLQMPYGFFYDLTMQLLQHPQEPEYTYTVPVLLVETNSGKGIVAYLRLELLSNGEGQLWPDPALAFVPRDEDFRGAETAAKTYLEQAQVWRNSYDVRWSLQRADKASLPRLVGNSLGGALVIGLAT